MQFKEAGRLVALCTSKLFYISGGEEIVVFDTSKSGEFLFFRHIQGVLVAGSTTIVTKQPILVEIVAETATRANTATRAKTQSEVISEVIYFILQNLK